MLLLLKGFIGNGAETPEPFLETPYEYQKVALTGTEFGSTAVRVEAACSGVRIGWPWSAGVSGEPTASNIRGMSRQETRRAPSDFIVVSVNLYTLGKGWNFQGMFGRAEKCRRL